MLTPYDGPNASLRLFMLACPACSQSWSLPSSHEEPLSMVKLFDVPFKRRGLNTFDGCTNRHTSVFFACSPWSIPSLHQEPLNGKAVCMLPSVLCFYACLRSWSIPSAHEDPLSIVKLFDVPGAAGSSHGNSLIVSGDEGGRLKIWDVRTRKQVGWWWCRCTALGLGWVLGMGVGVWGVGVWGVGVWGVGSGLWGVGVSA